MALSQLCEYLATKLEQKSITCSIFIDLCKAFDTVDHSILLYKLNCLGIRGVPANLIQSYLQERTQTTIVNGEKSNPAKIICGVPQGSILGPLLFLLYINDLATASLFEVRLFADDACLLLDHYKTDQLEKNVNLELIKINNWMKTNKLTINFSKTNYVIFSNKTNNYDYNIEIEGNVLDRVSNIKYLGVFINEKLKWGPHIEHLVTKVSKSSFLLSKLRHYVDLSTLKMLYYSIVYSHLNYCVSAWGGAPRTTLQPLNVIQKRIIRIITMSNFRCHTTPLFYNLEILTITDIYNLKLGILFHNITNNKFTGENNLISINSIHNYNTRLANSNNFYQSFLKTNQGITAYSSNGLKFWRSIPNKLKVSSLSILKFELKNY